MNFNVVCLKNYFGWCFQMRAQNTYLLALDGDIDFQPEAITRLVDKMKKNQNLGAACGRILPTGSGFMVTVFKDLLLLNLSCLVILVIFS